MSRLRPAHPGDWLLVAGDVAEESRVVLDVLAELRQRFARVIWVPGNHELWTHPLDRDDRRGLERYKHLVRHRDVLTPEVPYPTWQGTEQQFAVVPCLLLYDFTFRGGAASAEDALALAREVGHVFVDDYLLHRDPYPSVADWSRERVRLTEERLSRLPADRPITLPNHYPVLQRHARVMGSEHLPLWCGTEATEPWLVRFPIKAVVYGHLHIPTSAREGDAAFESDPDHEPLIATTADIGARIAGIKARPTASAFAGDWPLRFSLAGVQAKFALARIGGSWYRPDAHTPSTGEFAARYSNLGKAVRQIQRYMTRNTDEACLDTVRPETPLTGRHDHRFEDGSDAVPEAEK